MEEQLLNYGGWAFIGLLIVGVVALMKAGYVSLRDRFNRALHEEDNLPRGMTRKETIECFNTQYKMQEEAKIQGTPEK